MRYRPKRKNYPRGIYGDIDYQDRLERYCTYLERVNKELKEQCNIANVVGQSEQCKHQGKDLVRNNSAGFKCKCGKEVTYF